jgi:hypothetical protein
MHAYFEGTRGIGVDIDSVKVCCIMKERKISKHFPNILPLHTVRQTNTPILLSRSRNPELLPIGSPAIC